MAVQDHVLRDGTPMGVIPIVMSVGKILVGAASEDRHLLIAASVDLATLLLTTNLPTAIRKQYV